MDPTKPKRWPRWIKSDHRSLSLFEALTGIRFYDHHTTTDQHLDAILAAEGYPEVKPHLRLVEPPAVDEQAMEDAGLTSEQMDAAGLGLRQENSARNPLSKREAEILEQLAEGKNYKHIAVAVGLSTSTVRTHLHNVYEKLGVQDRANAVMKAQRKGWLGGGAVTEDRSREIELLEGVGRLLMRLIERLVEDGERGLSLEQREYLNRFDAYLRADSFADTGSLRLRMRQQLAKVLAEAGVEPEEPPQARVES